MEFGRSFYYNETLAELPSEKRTLLHFSTCLRATRVQIFNYSSLLSPENFLIAFLTTNPRFSFHFYLFLRFFFRLRRRPKARAFLQQIKFQSQPFRARCKINNAFSEPKVRTFFIERNRRVCFSWFVRKYR